MIQTKFPFFLRSLAQSLGAQSISVTASQEKAFACMVPTVHVDDPILLLEEAGLGDDLMGEYVFEQMWVRWAGRDGAYRIGPVEPELLRVTKPHTVTEKPCNPYIEIQFKGVSSGYEAYQYLPFLTGLRTYFQGDIIKTEGVSFNVGYARGSIVPHFDSGSPAIVVWGENVKQLETKASIVIGVARGDVEDPIALCRDIACINREKYLVDKDVKVIEFSKWEEAVNYEGKRWLSQIDRHCGPRLLALLLGFGIKMDVVQSYARELSMNDGRLVADPIVLDGYGPLAAVNADAPVVWSHYAPPDAPVYTPDVQGAPDLIDSGFSNKSFWIGVVDEIEAGPYKLPFLYSEGEGGRFIYNGLNISRNGPFMLIARNGRSVKKMAADLSSEENETYMRVLLSQFMEGSYITADKAFIVGEEAAITRDTKIDFMLFAVWLLDSPHLSTNEKRQISRMRKTLKNKLSLEAFYKMNDLRDGDLEQEAREALNTACRSIMDSRKSLWQKWNGE